MAMPCPVAGPPASATYRLTTSDVAAGSRPGSGSLSTVPPAGTVTDRSPPNDSCRLLPRTRAAPSFCTPASGFASSSPLPQLRHAESVLITLGGWRIFSLPPRIGDRPVGAGRPGAPLRPGPPERYATPTGRGRTPLRPVKRNVSSSRSSRSSRSGHPGRSERSALSSQSVRSARIPARNAVTTRCVRFFAHSFSLMLRMWAATVRGEIDSCWDMSASDIPWAARRRISSSRALSRPELSTAMGCLPCSEGVEDPRVVRLVRCDSSVTSGPRPSTIRPIPGSSHRLIGLGLSATGAAFARESANRPIRHGHWVRRLPRTAGPVT